KREQHLPRHAQDGASRLDDQPSERQHHQIGDDEDHEHRIDELRVLEEHGGTRVHALHVQYANDDGGDGVAGDAEDQGGDPGATHRRVVGGGGVDDALDVAGAVFLRLLREALGDGVG